MWDKDFDTGKMMGVRLKTTVYFGPGAIAQDCIYPLFSINDPALTTKLPPDQTRYVSIDAANHVIEAATSMAANPLSVAFGGETVRPISECLPKAIAKPEDIHARSCLLYASMIAGSGVDNSPPLYAHALEPQLSGMKSKRAHGQGLSVLLPAVVLECYPDCTRIPAKLLVPIVPGLKGGRARQGPQRRVRNAAFLRRRHPEASGRGLYRGGRRSPLQPRPGDAIAGAFALAGPGQVHPRAHRLDLPQPPETAGIIQTPIPRIPPFKQKAAFSARHRSKHLSGRSTPHARCPFARRGI